MSDEIPSIHIYCVVDRHPRFALEAWRWFETATSLAGVEGDRLTIGHVGLPSPLLRTLSERGAQLIEVEAFDSRSPHCNKISGAEAYLKKTDADAVALTDSDLAWCMDPVTLRPGDGVIRAKLVDRPNPPLFVLADVFDAAGVGLPDVATIELDGGKSDETVVTNFNGGFYCLNTATARRLVPEWSRWARWLLDNVFLLQRWFVHVDQVSMALAVATLELGVSHLEAEWNYPLHLPPDGHTTARPPSALHYHRHLTSIGMLRKSGVAAVDGQVRSVNEVLMASWREEFSNQAFWDWRYATDPELGSGVGSRSGSLKAKKDLFADLNEVFKPASVLDLGCGDSVVTADSFEGADWTGVDLSPEALKLSKQRRPTGIFLQGEAMEVGRAADLVLCLDVLIHQSSYAKLVELVRTVLHLAAHVALISGYETPPSTESPMVHFHEPLSRVLEELAPRTEWDRFAMLDVNGAIAFLLQRRGHSRYLSVTSEPSLEKWLANGSSTVVGRAGSSVDVARY